MRKFWLLLLFVPLLGCDTPEKQARDSIAAANGAIITVQTQYQTQCQADVLAGPCPLITRAVYAQRMAVSSLYVYCQFSAADPPEKKCQPAKDALGALRSAVVNLNEITAEIQKLVKP